MTLKQQLQEENIVLLQDDLHAQDNFLIKQCPNNKTLNTNKVGMMIT
jgi:hypothetical protein